MNKKILLKAYYSLIIGSVVVGTLSSFLGFSLKVITEYFEEHLLEIFRDFPVFYVLAPVIGISLIYIFRKYLFRGKKNKGIKEIFRTLEKRRDELPFYKVPSHYINGFLTVIFGGSTGIEVSTVVATAALGASVQKRKALANAHKTELISAGVAAGITVLFGSPIAGFLFAIEVISRKVTKTLLLSCTLSVLVAWGIVYTLDNRPLFELQITHYNSRAIPFFILVSILAGVVAVYFTKSVIFLKNLFEGINNKLVRVLCGALLVGILIFVFPGLYGDSYHALVPLLSPVNSENFTFAILPLVFMVFLKPLAASLTLGAGGDGGVFAPSIVTGAILGVAVALISNHFFGTDLILINFAIIGGAAMLSAAIHAPLTALFLACNIVEEGYVLFLPILIGVFIAKQVAKRLCDYTVYTYRRNKTAISFNVRG